jgi:sugar phosphate isomerase/epimerase
MFSIQENLLQGQTSIERFQLAKELGFQAVDVWAQSLIGDGILDIAQAIDASGLPVSSVFMGDLDGYVAEHHSQRDAAVERFRIALQDAHDLRVPYVVVSPQVNRPHESISLTPQQEKEYLIWFVRVVNDLAEAMNTSMCLLPLEPTQSRALNTLTQTYEYLAEMRFHPRVKIAGDLYSLHAQNESLTQSKESLNWLAMVYVHASENRQLPLSQATLTQLSALKTTGYSGHFSVACGLPSVYPCAPVDRQVLQEVLHSLQEA